MQQFLTNTLGPVFYNMGVSEADFAQYLESCLKYVYGILIALGVLIIILILTVLLEAFALIRARRKN